jgi:hypothetical protein
MFRFSDDFIRTVETNPAAYEAFRKSLNASIAAFGGSVLVLGTSINLLAGTIKDARDVNSGTIPNEERTVRDAGLVIAACDIMVICLMIRQHHINKGVRIFNAVHQ